MLLIGCDQSISDEDVQSWRGTSIKLLDDIFIPDNVILIKIYKSWHDNRATLSTYFKYPEAVRRLIYTINAIEGLNRQLRKVTKSKTVFPSDDSLLKMLYLATMDITKKWTGHRQDWGQIHSQLEIYFEERLAGRNL